MNVLKKMHKNEKLCKQIMDEICHAVENIDGWGSVEIVIQNNIVTQVTEKNIRKPQVSHKKI